MEDNLEGTRVYMWWTNRGNVGLEIQKSEDAEFELKLEEIVFPLLGYANNYRYTYVVELNREEKYAKVEIGGRSEGWALPGGQMFGSWTDKRGYLDREIVEKIKEKIKELKNIKEKDKTEFAVNFKKYYNEIIRLISKNLIRP